MIVLSGNMYSLLIILLLIKDLDDVIFVLSGNLDNSVFENLRNRGYTVFNYQRLYSKSELINLIYYHIQNVKYFFFRIRHRTKIKNSKVLYGADHLFSIYKSFAKKKMEKVLIEEGARNYSTFEDINEFVGINKKYYKIKKLLLGQWKLKSYVPYGFDKEISKIYLSGFRKIPLELSKKVYKFDLNELWLGSSKERQQLVNKIFTFDNSIYSQNTTVLLTQPLSEDGYCNEKEKIELYKNIICENNLQNVVIKKHPREITDYTKIISNILVDSYQYPFELLPLNNIKINKVVTIFSTSAYYFKGISNVEVIGTEKYEFLRRKVGVFEYEYYEV